MKKNVLLFFVMVVCGTVWAQTAAVNAGKTPATAAFDWSSTTFDFGSVKAGVPVSHEFTFTNSGQEPLVISSAKASCGCTVASYTRDPVPPGQAGVVKASFDAARKGTFTKTITVLANTKEGTVVLTIKATVE